MRVTSFQLVVSMTTTSFVLLTGTHANLPSGVNTGSNAILPTSIDFTIVGLAGCARLKTSTWPDTSVDPSIVLRSGETVNWTSEWVGPGIGRTSTLSCARSTVAI